DYLPVSATLHLLMTYDDEVGAPSASRRVDRIVRFAWGVATRGWSAGALGVRFRPRASGRQPSRSVRDFASPAAWPPHARASLCDAPPLAALRSSRDAPGRGQPNPHDTMGM